MMVRIDFFFLMSYLAKEKLSHSLFTLSPPNFFEHFIGLWNLKVWEPLSYGVMAPASSPAQWNQASRKNRSVRRDEGRRRDWVSDIHDHTEISLKAHWESIYCVSNPGLRPWRGKRKKRPLQEVLAAWEAEKLLEPSSLLDLSIQTMGRRSSDMARSMGLEWSSCLPGGGRLYLSMEGSRVWRDRKRSSGLSSEGRDSPAAAPCLVSPDSIIIIHTMISYWMIALYYVESFTHISFNHHTNPMTWVLLSPFMNEETKAQRGWISHPSSHSLEMRISEFQTQEVWLLSLHPNYYTLEFHYDLYNFRRRSYLLCGLCRQMLMNELSLIEFWFSGWPMLWGRATRRTGISPWWFV